MRRLALAAFGFAILALSGPARAERLVLSLSTHRVAIDANYTGAQLTLFGVIERDGQSVARPGSFDVIVTVRGPRETLTVRQKGAVGPIWINRDQQKFVSVPSVLGVFSSRPVGEAATASLRSRLRLGLQAIVDAPEATADRGEADDPFREALVRLKTRDGLWTEKARGVTFVTPEFFRAPLPIPATAPTGNYDVDVLVLSGGVVVARRETSFEVYKAGLEEGITTAARDHALPYGFAVAAMSLLFGWLASVIFRRD